MSGTHRAGLTERDAQSGTHRAGLTERDSQSGTHRAGLTERGLHRAGRTERDSQSGTHRAGRTERDSQSGTHRAGLCFSRGDGMDAQGGSAAGPAHPVTQSWSQARIKRPSVPLSRPAQARPCSPSACPRDVCSAGPPPETTVLNPPPPVSAGPPPRLEGVATPDPPRLGVICSEAIIKEGCFVRGGRPSQPGLAPSRQCH